MALNRFTGMFSRLRVARQRPTLLHTTLSKSCVRENIPKRTIYHSGVGIGLDLVEDADAWCVNTVSLLDSFHSEATVSSKSLGTNNPTTIPSTKPRPTVLDQSRIPLIDSRVQADVSFAVSQQSLTTHILPKTGSVVKETTYTAQKPRPASVSINPNTASEQLLHQLSSRLDERSNTHTLHPPRNSIFAHSNCEISIQKNLPLHTSYTYHPPVPPNIPIQTSQPFSPRHSRKINPTNTTTPLQSPLSRSQIQELTSLIGKYFPHILHAVCGPSALLYHGSTTHAPPFLSLLVAEPSVKILKCWAISQGLSLSPSRTI